MERSVPVSEFLHMRSDRVVLDVRSPGEFAQGHIPGAVAFPLFTDEERAKVGTVYKQQGKEQAMELGLAFVGPNMANFVKKAKKLAPDRRLLVHCWRGGQRSRSMAWLLRLSGFDVATLEGGYKMYRQHLLQSFEALPLADLRVIGGRTGTGKTKVLRALQAMGEQVIDLEAIAHHKGSAFGSIGEAPQPTVEQFENDLYDAMSALDWSRTIWTENESRSIGRVFIPQGFWQVMKAAPLYNIAIPEAARLQNLVDDYTGTDPAELIAAFHKIDSKLGGLQLKQALEAVEQGDYAAAAGIALRYYDKTYQHCLDNNPSPEIKMLAFDYGDPQRIAAEIRKMPRLI